MQIQLFDSRSMECLCDIPLNNLKNKIHFIAAFVKNGLSKYILNAGDSEMKVILLNEYLIPVVETKKGEHCYVLSPTAHYLKYSQEEISLLDKSVYKYFLLSLLHFGSIFFKIFNFNKTVYVNNWLFSTNPPLYLEQNEVIKLRDFLTKKYPEKAIIIRSIDSFNKNYHNILRASGFQLIINREIHYWEPAELGKIHNKKRRHVKQDIALSERDDFVVETLHTASRNDYLRISELYRMLYISKYTELNPQYTAEFMERAHADRILDFTVIRKEDIIVGFISSFETESMIYILFIGYDIAMDKANGWHLYRMIFGLLYKRSLNSKKRLFMSSGAGDFKKQRGSKTQYEYEAIYIQHLPFLRRIPWLLMQAGIKLNAEKVYASNVF